MNAKWSFCLAASKLSPPMTRIAYVIRQRGIQERSGGRDTSGNSLRNIKDEAAEPEKVSAVSDLSADIPDEQPKEHSDGFENSKRSKNGDIILGNTTFRYIPEKTYTKISKDIAAEVADQLEKQGVKFSGVIKGDTATITVSKPQKEALDSIIASVSSTSEVYTNFRIDSILRKKHRTISILITFIFA